MRPGSLRYRLGRLVPLLLLTSPFWVLFLLLGLGVSPWHALLDGWRHSPLFRASAVAVAAIILIHLVRAALVDSRIDHTRLEYASPRLTPRLDGYTIAFLSDIHLISGKRLRAAVARINETGVNTALLGGDYSHFTLYDPCMQVLSGIHAPDGIYGVAGNHDKPLLLEQVMKQYGIALLQNRGVQVRSGFFVAGVEDFWRGAPDIGQALDGASAQDFVLLLCHNPDGAMALEMQGVDLVLAGHTHGGEITLFGRFAPALLAETAYPLRFGGGWAKGNGETDIYVGRGIGRSLRVLPRVFARPQVVYVTFRRTEIVDKT